MGVSYQMSVPRLVRLNRRLSWLLVLVSVLVLALGYGQTVLDLDSGLVWWGHSVLGVVFGIVFLAHMLISVFVIRYDWGRSVRGVLGGEAGGVTWLRLGQRVSGWTLVASALLVLLSGLDWFKLGTGWILPFASHVRFDLFLSLTLIFHVTIGGYFVLLRRRLRAGVREPSGFSAARREAIVLMAGMTVSFLAVTYLDRLPRISDAAERLRGLLPQGQYEVGKLRVLHVGAVPEFDEGSWTLVVDGLVENPVTLSYGEVRGLPGASSVSDFHCVTGWTKFDNRWEGVLLRTIMEIVRPLPSAGHVLFLCERDYSTSLPVEELVGDDVILAYGLGGGDLQAEHGGPLRLVVPQKYGYKSAKWVRVVRFVDENVLGYWEARGYSDTADPFTNDRYHSSRATRN